MKIIIFASYARSLINFRGPLIRAMLERGHTVVACAPENDPEVRERLAEWGVAYHSIPLDRNRINPLYDLSTLLAVRSFLARAQPDLLLSYTMKPVVYGSLAARSLGIRSASMITGLGSTFSDGAVSIRQRLLRFFLERLLRISLHSNQVVFFQNADDVSYFTELGLVRSEQAVLVDGSGVDLDYFTPSEPAEKPPVFLLMARLIREKGIVEYVEAARRLKRLYPHAIFRLLGSFEDGPNAISPDKVAAWSDEGVIEYMGSVADVRPYLEKCTAVVLPSYYREGIPRSLLEALAVGRPVITTNMPGCRETVIEGENGFLVPPKDPDALAKAMEVLIQNPHLIQKFCRRSRELAEARFDANKVNHRILQSLGL